MALYDFGLSQSNGTYTLEAPTFNEAERIRDRFTVLFLSRRKVGRGSYFVSELAAGRLMSSADIVNIFSITAAQIISEMRQLALEIVPIRAALVDFRFENTFTIVLDVTLFTNLGSINTTITATTEDTST